MRIAQSTVLVGIALAGWAIATDVANAQVSYTPNPGGFGSSTVRRVTPPPVRGYSRTVTRGGTVRGGGGVGAAAGAANAAIGVIGAIGAAMPGESRTDVPAWPPPASCAQRYAGSWLVNYAGQTYTATINANGTGTAHCPFCMPSQRWTCRGNEYFLLDPVIITMRMSADGNSWTSANGSGRRMSPGQQVASVGGASTTGASLPPGASQPPNASAAGGPGVTYGPGQTYAPRNNAGSVGLNAQFNRQNNCGSDITGTGGAPRARSAECRRGGGNVRMAQRATATFQTAQRTAAAATARNDRAGMRRAQAAFSRAAQEYTQAGDTENARRALENARTLERALASRATASPQSTTGASLYLPPNSPHRQAAEAPPRSPVVANIDMGNRPINDTGPRIEWPNGSDPNGNGQPGNPGGGPGNAGGPGGAAGGNQNAGTPGGQPSCVSMREYLRISMAGGSPPPLCPGSGGGGGARCRDMANRLKPFSPTGLDWVNWHLRRSACRPITQAQYDALPARERRRP